MSGAVHVRIDNRLLHGQVVQFWIPHLEVERLIIADDETAANPAMTAVYRMAVASRVALMVVPIDELPALTSGEPSPSTLILLSDVFDATRAIMCGARIDSLVLGNVHATPGRERITDSVYLSTEELAALVRFCRDGGSVEIKTFPGERLRLEVSEDGVPKWSKR